MKPDSKPTTTPFPFEAASVYKTDFNGKQSHPQSIFIRESTFPKFPNMSMVKQSNYAT
jgi:hypothetical protein